MESLRKDLAFYRAQGTYAGKATVDDIVDSRFAADAVKELGTYKPKS